MDEKSASNNLINFEDLVKSRTETQDLLEAEFEKCSRSLNAEPRLDGPFWEFHTRIESNEEVYSLEHIIKALENTIRSLKNIQHWKHSEHFCAAAIPLYLKNGHIIEAGTWILRYNHKAPAPAVRLDLLWEEARKKEADTEKRKPKKRPDRSA